MKKLIKIISTACAFSIYFLTIYCPTNIHAAVIFQDNFDSRSDSHAVYGETAIDSDGKWSWVCQSSGDVSATLDGITHYGAEISHTGNP